MLWRWKSNEKELNEWPDIMSGFFLESVDKIDIRYRRERKTVIKKKPRTRFARRGSRLARPKGCRNDCVVPERAGSPQDGAPPHVSSLKTCHRHVF